MCLAISGGIGKKSCKTKNETISLRYSGDLFAGSDHQSWKPDCSSFFLQVDNLVDVVEFENQRAIYADDQRAILAGHSSLNEMMDKMEALECEDEKTCMRAKTRIAEVHHKDFNVQGNNANANGSLLDCIF